MQIASLVQGFLLENSNAGTVWSVCAEKLQICGFGCKTKRGRKKLQAQFDFQHTFAALRCLALAKQNRRPGVRTQGGLPMVRIIAAKTKLADTDVLQSFLLEKESLVRMHGPLKNLNFLFPLFQGLGFLGFRVPH